MDKQALRVLCATFAMTMVASASAHAQTPQPQAQQTPSPQQTAPPKQTLPPKQTPPPKQSPQPTPQATQEKPEPPSNIPLFPRYRRGLYKNGLGLWVIDGPPQSPPLFTDDPGVPDKGVYELNFTTRADLASSLRSYDFFHVDANFGIVAKVHGHDLPMQLKLEGPVSGVQEPGLPITAGPGDFETGLKILFYENDDQGVAMSVYPQLGFHMSSTSVDKGVAEPGQTFVLPLLVSKQFHYMTLVFNGGVEVPFNDPDRTTIGTGSAAVGFVVRRHLALMGEIGFESPFNGQETVTTLINGGVMRSLGHYAVLYGNVGTTLTSPDDERHVFVGIGVKFMIVPDRK